MDWNAISALGTAAAAFAALFTTWIKIIGSIAKATSSETQKHVRESDF